MLKERARLVAGGLRVLDVGMLAVAFPVAYWVRDTLIQVPSKGLYPIGTYWPLLAASILVWQVASRFARLYDRYRTKGILDEIVRLVRSFVLLALLMAAGQFVLKQHEVSRLFFGLFYAIAFALLTANRVVVRLSARAARRRGYNTRAFAVVGSGPMTEGILKAIATHREWGYTFAGYVLEEGAEPPVGGKVLGRIPELGRVLERNVVDEVVLAVPRERLDVIEQAVEICEEQGVVVRVLLDFFPTRISKMEVEELDGIPVLSLTPGPSEMAPLVGKRVFDVVVSALVLVLLLPLWLVIALAIKLDSPGPVLYRQRRMGQNGRRFWLYKFRSMVHGAHRQLPSLRARNEMDGPVFKMRHDPRVTRVGRWLRKTSLDEIPQFWNVLRGEMSVVGPRPPLPHEVREYERWHRRRLSVRPGITCTWQVSGRNEVDFERWMELDLHYIDNWSLWHDLKIVLQTIPAVILGRGAR
jgi:exopolysaccharide biosynthesis polyprenyl glycosylphosphotransferase